MNHLVLLSFSVDPSLGRIDKSTLSQETLMELLISQIVNKEVICGPEEDLQRQWKEVTLNENGEVLRIQWIYYKLEGTFHLEWLPPTATSVMVTYNSKLEGTIHLTSLPEPLIKLNLARNSFSGEIDLTRLPAKLERLYVNANQFCGTVCLTKLPSSLVSLYLSENQFFGPVDLTSLPEGLEDFRLHNNDFSGETDFLHLPENLRELHADHTKLSGDLYAKDDQYFYVEKSQVKIHEV
mmetsp:Transcript_20841/g.32518  ORF Transcript_20841/g.32518 Transcript_20841/m.32518 type:complete len:238 (-) Transcript_20841:32-745(-)